jgi:hypothetical protein
MIKLLIIFLTILIFYRHGFSAPKPEEKNFLTSVSNGEEIKKNRVIVKKKDKPAIKRIMGDRYKKAIFSYWTLEDKTIWILNSIGKYKPITAGFVISNCKVDKAYVIVYREQHGYEIKYNSFLNQFKDNKLNEKNKLNNNLDNISGATLSVNSMDRMGRLALVLNSTVNEKSCNQKNS